MSLGSWKRADQTPERAVLEIKAAAAEAYAKGARYEVSIALTQHVVWFDDPVKAQTAKEMLGSDYRIYKIDERGNVDDEWIPNASTP